MFSGFPTPDKQNILAPYPKSRGEEDSERSQLQVHHYSDSTIGISDSESTVGATVPKGYSSLPGSATLEKFANLSGKRLDETLDAIIWQRGGAGRVLA